ncbi:MAG TPA: hypothetical protein VFZ08_08350 [Terriglobia bacterium]|nr:hypothetical protein [Terriglobia bacterium]
MPGNSSATRVDILHRSESGKGYASLFVTLIILLIAAFVAYQTLPVYVHNYELNDYTTDLAQQVAVHRVQPEDVPALIAARAQDLNLPVAPDNVKVDPGGSAVKIEVAYTALIDLWVYIWSLHFSISASAPRIALG